MTAYIATESGGRDRWMAIYGVGETAEAALAEAREQDSPVWDKYAPSAADHPTATGEGAWVPAPYDVLTATDRLVAHVREHGGAPGDVRWDVVDGVADLRDR